MGEEEARLCKVSFLPYVFKFTCLKMLVDFLSFEAVAFLFMLVLFMGKERGTR